MVQYSIISQRFNTEFRNGSSFSTNPTTDFSTDLKANVGELCQLSQSIQISVTVNPLEIQTIQWNATSDSTYGEFIGTGINFLNEGLYVGAVIDVTWGGGAAVSATVNMITGTGYSIMKVTKASLVTAGITNGDIRVDFKIRLTSVPDTLIYKYGLNPNDYSGANYTSWFDGNIQGYYISNLTGSYQTMTRQGVGIKSWDLSTVQAKFDSTTSTYFHQYSVVHTFRIPQYVEGEHENINDGTSPTKFLGSASIRYDNGWFFGGTTLGEYIKVNIQGGPGNVGYFKESYNGSANNYLVQNVSISNADNSGLLEGSVANTVTFQIKKSSGNFTTSSKVILYHSKLPTQVEYQNKTSEWATLWLFDSLVTTESAGAVSSTIITNLNLTLNADPTILDVTATIQYTSVQQSLILDGSNYLLWVSVGNEGAINPDDRVALPVDLDQFSKNLDVPGLITSATATFFEPFEFPFGSRGITTFTGFDGDLGGAALQITRDNATTAAISKVQFKIISTNGTEEIELLAIDVPIGKIQTVNVGGEVYQILNTNTLNNFTLPTKTLINRIVGIADQAPSSPTGSQDYYFALGFQVPWRDWVFNNSVPAELYTVSLPQNNQNYKTSNYSNSSGYEVFAVWDVTLSTNDGVNTIYRKLTAESNITDFDTNGTAGFSGSVKYLNGSGTEVTDLSPVSNRLIVISFPHSSGTIPKVQIEGYIWIERDGSVEQPWFIHSSIDCTKIGHPLLPTDTELTGNTQFVEVRTINNLVTLTCQTDHNFIQDGVTYNVYGRLKNKTVL
jgi:hypothetical protein